MQRLRERIEDLIKECKQRQEGERWYSQTYTEAAGRIAVYHEVLTIIDALEARP